MLWPCRGPHLIHQQLGSHSWIPRDPLVKCWKLKCQKRAVVTGKPLGEQNFLLVKSDIASLSLQGCIDLSWLGAQVKRLVIQQLVQKLAKYT